MNARARHVLITCANGYIGRRLVSRMLDDPRFDDCRITLLDLNLSDIIAAPCIRRLEGDFGDQATIATAIDGRADIVIHLAGILGGTAEGDYALSRRVNVDGALNLFEALRDSDDPPRLVFASSIAVFGTDIPPLIDDDTMPQPTMIYGAHKRMMEVVIEHFTARGWIDGYALRLPGIVARRDVDSRLKSAFLNLMFYDFEVGRDIVLPVTPDSTTWLISVPACVEALLHAACLPAGDGGPRRAFTLPAQRVQIDQLVTALAARFPDSPTQVHYAVDRELDQQFARQPALVTKIADDLGFLHDGDITALVRRAML